VGTASMDRIRKPKALRSLEEIQADFLAIKKETDGLINDIVAGEKK
jgi:hypothetical protein